MAASLPPDTPGRLVRDGYVQEHTEIASYELLERVAMQAGDSETVERRAAHPGQRARDRGEARGHMGPSRRALALDGPGVRSRLT